MEERNAAMQQNSEAQGQPKDGFVQADAPTINDSKASVSGNGLMEGAAGQELNPEYGDAADPTSEMLGNGGRDDASTLKTSTDE